MDPLLLKESEYLTQVSHEFRVRIKKMVDMREKASTGDMGPQSCIGNLGPQYSVVYTLHSRLC